MNKKKIAAIGGVKKSLRRMAEQLTWINSTSELGLKPGADEQKIAVIGNMNNSPLRLVEGLRSIGRDAHLFVSRKEILHRPESIYPELMQSGYPSWMHDVSDVAREHNVLFDNAKKDKLIRRINREFRLSILNDWAPSLAEEFTQPHLTLLTGSDVSYYADFGTLVNFSSSWNHGFTRSASGRRTLREVADTIKWQRNGIASSTIVIHPWRGLVPVNDRILDQLGVEDDIRLELSPCRTKQTKFAPPPKNEIPRILSASRVNFSRFGEGTIFTNQDMKGTDILLEGFARFCNGGGKAELHLIEKGNDIHQARTVSAGLSLNEHIVWHEEMTTHQLCELMKSADIVCDQFNASPLGLITLDAYALGRPVMANFAANDLPGRFPEPLPGLPASTPEEIAVQLATMAEDTRLGEELGAQSRRYAEKYLSCEVMAQKLLDRYSQTL